MSEPPTTTANAEGTATAPAGAEPLSFAESASNAMPAANGTPAGDDRPQATGQVRRTRVRKAGRQASAGPIEQAVAVRDSLRESVAKSNELIRTLKRQRQQSRLVATTLASLKQLQQAG